MSKNKNISATPQQLSINRTSMLWVMSCAGFSIVPHLTRMPVIVALGLLLLIGYRTSRYYRSPHWVLRTTAVLLAVAIIFWLHQGLWGRLPGSQLLCCMLILKSLELNVQRDALLMVSLSFFVVATWFLFDQSLVTFVYLVIATWLGLTTMIVINLRKGSNTDIIPMFKAGARLALPAIPMALAMFMLFPRLSVPMWGIQGGETEGVTGLSDRMSPGAISDLFINDGPAFRVQFEAEPPPQAERYWRGPVLWNFDGREWRQSFYSNSPADNRPAAAAADYRYEIELEPHRQRWLFALDYPATTPDDAMLSLDYQLRSERPVYAIKRYSIASDVDFVDSPDLRITLQRQALQLPDNGGQQARELAQQWRAAAMQSSSNPADMARQIIQTALSYYRQQPFYYRLDSLPLLDDPIDEFLFDSRSGYCEHYASSFTYLMRAAGLPARIVTGYQGGFPNGDYLLVRQSDAHAWSEVWIDGAGWTRVDPTNAVSPARILRGSRAAVEIPNWLHSPWLVSMRNRADRLRHWWNRNIVSFNASRQQRLLSPFGIERLNQSQLLLGLMAICLLLGSIIFWLYQRHDPRRNDPLARSYTLLKRRLRRTGMDIQPHITPVELVNMIRQQLPRQQAVLSPILQTYIRLRYARHRGTDQAFVEKCQRLHEKIRQLRLRRRKANGQ